MADMPCGLVKVEEEEGGDGRQFKRRFEILRPNSIIDHVLKRFFFFLLPLSRDLWEREFSHGNIFQN